MNLSPLKQLPPGVAEGFELIRGFDNCLALGFARLGPGQHQELDRLAAVFAGTPLENPLAEATAAIRRSEFLTRNFCALATARAAIQGAQYDALLKQVSDALERPVMDFESARPLASGGTQLTWLSSTQQWLMELALAGFKHLSPEALAPFITTLEQIQSSPALTRTGALLNGFLTELLAGVPSEKESIPLFRWSDLWTRAMITAQQPPSQETGATVSGKFFPLGVDVRSHAHFASLVIYGLFESGKDRRLVRVPLSSFKVDVVSGKEIWQLFRPGADSLMESLASQKQLDVSNMRLLPGGDLLWTGKVLAGERFDPVEITAIAASAKTTPVPAQSPLTRHPVQLAELVCLEKCSVQSNGNSLLVTGEGFALPLNLERLGPGSELDVKTVEQAAALGGLLRFDRMEWSIQPLWVRTKPGKKERLVMTGCGALEFCLKDKLKTLATLSERAGKLLRQS